MDKKQVKIFADLVGLYDQLCEVYVTEMDDIETIENLAYAEEWSAIEALFNEDEEYSTGPEMFEELFGKTLNQMNELCDQHGYQRIEYDD